MRARLPSEPGDSLAEPLPASAKGDRVFDAFQRAFGSDLGRLEKPWRRFMETVQTPLEQHAGADSPSIPGRPPGRRKS